MFKTLTLCIGIWSNSRNFYYQELIFLGKGGKKSWQFVWFAFAQPPQSSGKCNPIRLMMFGSWTHKYIFFSARVLSLGCFKLLNFPGEFLPPLPFSLLLSFQNQNTNDVKLVYIIIKALSVFHWSAYVISIREDNQNAAAFCFGWGWTGSEADQLELKGETWPFCLFSPRSLPNHRSDGPTRASLTLNICPTLPLNWWRIPRMTGTPQHCAAFRNCFQTSPSAATCNFVHLPSRLFVYNFLQLITGVFARSLPGYLSE